MTDKITIKQNIKEKNNAIAEDNARTFETNRILTVNMISSPGSGKTSLLETLAGTMGKELAVITGDIQTELDAERLTASGAAAIQIQTGGACHLNADMIRDALAALDLDTVSVLVIENVGNLVCPSTYHLGEHIKTAVLSIPEGDEKPIKYPALFIRAHSVIFNKIDLLPYLDFDIRRAEEDCLRLNRDIKMFRTSCKTGEGMDELAGYLLSTHSQIYGT